MKNKGRRCLIIEKRNHIGGNIFTEKIEGIDVHKYGAHIFHTNNKHIFDYIQSLGEFNNFINSPIAKWKDKIYNLPFNMNTFHAMWGITQPEEAYSKIEEQRKNNFVESPRNLEEQAINLVGIDIYERLIKGYTEKQWGRSCKELPAFIINRIPIRCTYDNNYFNDRFQGIPINGYTKIIENLLSGCDVITNSDFLTKGLFFQGKQIRSFIPGQ